MNVRTIDAASSDNNNDDNGALDGSGKAEIMLSTMGLYIMSLPMMDTPFSNLMSSQEMPPPRLNPTRPISVHTKDRFTRRHLQMQQGEAHNHSTSLTDPYQSCAPY